MYCLSHIKAYRTYIITLPCLRLSPASLLRAISLNDPGDVLPLVVSLEPDDSAVDRSKDGSIFHQEVTVTCVRPFLVPPSIALTWPNTAQQQVDPNLTPRSQRRAAFLPTAVIPLPITIADFVEGYPMMATAFRQNWTALSSPSQTAQAIVQHEALPSPATLSDQADSRRSNVESPQSVPQSATGVIEQIVLDTLGLAKIPDPIASEQVVIGVELMAAAGVLRTAVPGGQGAGDGPSVGCLVGVEFNRETRASRVTVKSANHVLAVGVLKAIVTQCETIMGIAAR